VYKLGKTVQQILSVERTVLKSPLMRRFWPRTQLLARWGKGRRTAEYSYRLKLVHEEESTSADKVALH
jgi:hypothetical protein